MEAAAAPPFCSVVVPTRNRAKLLHATLASVAAQTDADWECVVVDDGGHDGSADVVAQFGPRFRYHWQPHAERCIARNTGVQLARGRYVYFLDSDDLLTPDCLSEARTCLQALGHPEVLHTRYLVVDDALRVLPESARFQNYHADPTVQNQYGCCCFVRRDIALRHPFPPEPRLRIGEDWYLGLVLGLHYPIHCNTRHTRLVRQHAGRTVAQRDIRPYLESAALLRRYLGSNERFRTQYPHGLGNVLSELYSLAALHATQIPAPLDALRCTWHALRARPRFVGRKRFWAIGKHLLLLPRHAWRARSCREAPGTERHAQDVRTG